MDPSRNRFGDKKEDRKKGEHRGGRNFSDSELQIQPDAKSWTTRGVKEGALHRIRHKCGEKWAYLYTRLKL